MRRVVMGDDATSDAADAATRSRRWSRYCTNRSRAGALGFSSSLGDAHTDGDGAPVPSRAAERDEFLALARRGARARGHHARVHPRRRRDQRRPHGAHGRHVARRRPSAQLEPARQPVADRDLRAAAQVVRISRPREGAHVVALTLARPHAHAREPLARVAARLEATSCACPTPIAAPRVADPAVRARLRAGVGDAAQNGPRGDGALRPDRDRRGGPLARAAPSTTSPLNGASNRPTCSSTSCFPTASRSRPCSCRRSCRASASSHESWEARGRRLARPARLARRLRRRRAHRPHVPRQLPVGGARARGARTRAVRAGRRGAPHDRPARAACSGCAAGVGSPTAGTPI